MKKEYSNFRFSKLIYLFEHLIIQTWVIENAFKYGVVSTNEESHVEIILRVTQKEIRLQVINSIPENRLPHKPSTGTGLANLQERLQYSYPLRHYLTNSKTKTTLVYLVYGSRILVCPLQKNQATMNP